jgi:hypothetical protein
VRHLGQGAEVRALEVAELVVQRLGEGLIMMWSRQEIMQVVMA